MATTAIQLVCSATVAVSLILTPLPALTQTSSLPSSRLDEAARAAGLQPLREQRLPAGEREVRVWLLESLGYPQRFVRVRASAEGTRGDLFQYWIRDRDSTRPDSTRYEALIRYNEAGRCGEIRSTAQIEACPVLFDSVPDWRSFLASADSAGLRSLPDESDLHDDRPNGGVRIRLDGWELVVEEREGPAYRTYRYWSPSDESERQEIRHAAGIARLVGVVFAHARRPDVEQVYRGRWERRGNLGLVSEFRPCGQAETWELKGFYNGVPSLAADEGRTDYVEVRGVLAPTWLSREWKSPYRRVLQVYDVLVRREWDPALCAAP